MHNKRKKIHDYDEFEIICVTGVRYYGNSIFFFLVFVFNNNSKNMYDSSCAIFSDVSYFIRQNTYF